MTAHLYEEQLGKLFCPDQCCSALVLHHCSPVWRANLYRCNCRVYTTQGRVYSLHYIGQNAVPTVHCCSARQAHSRQSVTAVTPKETSSSYKKAVSTFGVELQSCSSLLTGHRLCKVDNDLYRLSNAFEMPIDKAATHVCSKRFRLVAMVLEQNRQKLLDSACSQPTRILANNDGHQQRSLGQPFNPALQQEHVTLCLTDRMHSTVWSHIWQQATRGTHIFNGTIASMIICQHAAAAQSSSMQAVTCRKQALNAD